MKDYTAQLDTIFAQLIKLEDALQKDYSLWQKASPQCPPNDEKKSPNVEPNVSTTSNEHINTIPLQVPKQHRNATLIVRKNLLTSRHELVYRYEDSETHQLYEEVLNDAYYGFYNPQPQYIPTNPNPFPNITW